jgi:thiosulfate/3-mercaptopyruvate sulfurtransferase
MFLIVAALAVATDTAWVVSAAQLRAAPPESTVVLDARGGRDYRAGHVPGAVRINWLRYRDGWLRSGRLPRDLDELGRRLAALGVDGQRRVVVYGNAHRGWGEEGRIVWMLRYLGLPRVAMLDGGWSAWLALGGPKATGTQRRPPGRVTVRPVAELRAFRHDVEAARAPANALILDVRSEAEWNGATPYWEKRGGRIPAAVHLEWKLLLDSAGRLLPRDVARARLTRVGIADTTPVIVYCTGGVRSSFALVALKHLGVVSVRNYDGSWWEWTS